MISSKPKLLLIILLMLGVIFGGYFVYQKFFKTPGKTGEKAVHQLLVQIQIPKGDPESLKERYERGDVISVSSGEKSWSLAEKESFLIIKANITDKQAELLMQPKQTEAKTTALGSSTPKEGQTQMETVKLRRYGIDLGKLGIAPDDEKGRQIDKVFEDNIIVEKK